MKVTRLALALGLSLAVVAVIAGKGPGGQLVILNTTAHVDAAGDLELTVVGMNFGAAEPWVFLAEIPGHHGRQSHGHHDRRDVQSRPGPWHLQAVDHGP